MVSCFTGHSLDGFPVDVEQLAVHGAEPGIDVDLERSLEVPAVGEEIRPVDHGGDSRLSCAEQANQRCRGSRWTGAERWWFAGDVVTSVDVRPDRAKATSTNGDGYRRKPA